MKNILIYIILLFIGFYISQIYITITHYDSKKIIDIEYKQIIKQLIELNNNDILMNNCEIDNLNNTKTMSSLKVNDFLTNYIYASFDNSFKMDFECSNRKENMCSLNFGQSKSNEGWKRFLFFKYDFNNKLIIPNSFECVDVP